MNGMWTFPQPEEALSELRIQIVQTVAALDYGALKAKEFFTREDKGNPFDKHLASHLVRYFARKYLVEAGATIEDEPSLFEMDYMALSGLSMRAGRYWMRIWKADDGEVPAPGPSKRRQRFFQQLILGHDIEDERPINVILVWDVNSNYEIASICLACPNGGGPSKASVEFQWNLPLDVAMFRRITTRPQDQERDDDLDISLDRDKAGEEIE
jgi:hypothetical protein